MISTNALPCYNGLKYEGVKYTLFRSLLDAYLLKSNIQILTNQNIPLLTLKGCRNIEIKFYH
jgi:hypothetical protein